MLPWPVDHMRQSFRCAGLLSGGKTVSGTGRTRRRWHSPAQGHSEVGPVRRIQTLPGRRRSAGLVGEISHPGPGCRCTFRSDPPVRSDRCATTTVRRPGRSSSVARPPRWRRARILASALATYMGQKLGGARRLARRMNCLPIGFQAASEEGGLIIFSLAKVIRACSATIRTRYVLEHHFLARQN